MPSTEAARYDQHVITRARQIAALDSTIAIRAYFPDLDAADPAYPVAFGALAGLVPELLGIIDRQGAEITALRDERVNLQVALSDRDETIDQYAIDLARGVLDA